MSTNMKETYVAPFSSGQTLVLESPTSSVGSQYAGHIAEGDIESKSSGSSQDSDDEDSDSDTSGKFNE